VPVSQVRQVRTELPLVHHLGLLGQHGLAAYLGMLKIGQIEVGETVVVSAAAGGVGHLAGQMAANAGASVIGITGSAEKNRILEEELGFSRTVNRCSPTFPGDLRAACGAGADTFLGHIGGPVLDPRRPLMAAHGRAVCYGAVARYDADQDAVLAPGPRGIPLLVINETLRVAGFLIADFASERSAAFHQLAEWAERDQLKTITKVWDGLDAAPHALMAMLAGGNVGQVVVRVGPDPALLIGPALSTAITSPAAISRWPTTSTPRSPARPDRARTADCERTQHDIALRNCFADEEDQERWWLRSRC
jgi:NADPH-dependent curcumin reductase CurA